MKSQKILAFGVIVALLLVGSVVALDTSDGINTLEEAREVRLLKMSFGERIALIFSPRFQELEVSGQARGCSNQPYEGICSTQDPKHPECTLNDARYGFVAQGKQVCKGGGVEVVNLFNRKIEQGEWIEGFIDEYDAPTFAPSGTYYQCYNGCDPLPTKCSPGEKTCWTASIYKVCQNNNVWKDYTCASGTRCGGKGICSSDNVGAKCGDGYCSEGEVGICLSDCPTQEFGDVGAGGWTPRTEYCTDTKCSAFEETSGTCPQDCGTGATGSGTETTTGTSGGGTGLTSCGDNLAITFKHPTNVNPGDDVSIEATFTNPLTQDCTINSEAGMYIKEYGLAGDEPLLAITATPISACGVSLGFLEETFTDSKRLVIPASSFGKVTYEFKAPNSFTKFATNAGEFGSTLLSPLPSKNWNGYGDDYFFVVGTYEVCGKGYKNWETEQVTMGESTDTSETCGNSRIDNFIIKADENCNNCPADAGCGRGEVCKATGGLELGGLFGLIKIDTGLGTDYQCEQAGITDVISPITLLIIAGVGLAGLYIFLKFR